MVQHGKLPERVSYHSWVGLYDPASLDKKKLFSKNSPTEIPKLIQFSYLNPSSLTLQSETLAPSPPPKEPRTNLYRARSLKLLLSPFSRWRGGGRKIGRGWSGGASRGLSRRRGAMCNRKALRLEV